MKKDTHSSIYYSIMKVIHIYDQDYRRRFSFHEFENFDAIHEVVLELKENKFAKINYRKQEFYINVSGIRYLKHLIQDEYYKDFNYKNLIINLFIVLCTMVLNIISSMSDLSFKDQPLAASFVLFLIFGFFIYSVRSLVKFLVD